MKNFSQMKSKKLLFICSMAVSLLVFSSSCSKDDNNNNITLGNVTTTDVTEITSTSAKCGGTITNFGSSGNYTSGICWSPIMGSASISGSHTTTTKESTFSAVMTGLTANTTYYVKAYFTNEAGTVYGNEKSFKTTDLSDPNLVRSWNVNEDGSTAPWGIAIDQEDNVYTSEMFGGRIGKFTSVGALITRWGTLGNGNGQFNQLKQIAVDGSGNVYAADAMNFRVQKFTSSGTYITQWGNPVPVAGEGAWGVGTIAVDATNGWVYVVDQFNRLLKFDLSGNFITQWGGQGSGDGQLMLSNQANPTNQGPDGQMAVDAAGNVYVVDNMNFRVQKFTSSGTYLTKWGSQGSGEGQFLFPQGIAIDNTNGFIYVSDNSLSGGSTDNITRIEKFDLQGHFIKQWTYENQSLGTLAIKSAGNVLAISGKSVYEYHFQ